MTVYLESIPAWHFCVGWAIPLSFLFGPVLFAGWVRYAMPAVLLLTLVPLLDMVFPLPARPSKKEIPKGAHMSDFRSYSFVLSVQCVLCLASMVALVVWADDIVSDGWASIVGAVAAGGTLGLSVSLCAHELFHKVLEPFERTAGLVLQSVSLNPVYVFGHHYHHQRMCTPEDGTTARKGEAFFAYLVRRERMNWEASIAESRAALAQARKGNALPFLVGRDRFLTGLLISACTLVSVFFVGGRQALCLYAAACTMAWLQIATGDYIQHYGLVRARDEVTGKLEPVSLLHSWNCVHVPSAVSTFATSAHAMHHVGAMLPFGAVHDTDGTPTMPMGIVALSIAAFVPSVFFKVMNPALEAHQEAVNARRNTDGLTSTASASA